jgi:hypothetical protein
MRNLLILLVITSLSACSSYKQFQRIAEKHPEVLDSFIKVKYITTVDTLVDLDTFVQTEYKDSFILDRDTTIVTERVVITKRGPKIYVTLPADTVVMRDTIRIFPKQPIVEYKPTKSYYVKIWEVLPVIFIAGSLLLLVMFLKKSK